MTSTSSQLLFAFSRISPPKPSFISQILPSEKFVRWVLHGILALLGRAVSVPSLSPSNPLVPTPTVPPPPTPTSTIPTPVDISAGPALLCFATCVILAFCGFIARYQRSIQALRLFWALLTIFILVLGYGLHNTISTIVPLVIETSFVQPLRYFGRSLLQALLPDVYLERAFWTVPSRCFYYDCESALLKQFAINLVVTLANALLLLSACRCARIFYGRLHWSTPQSWSSVGVSILLFAVTGRIVRSLPPIGVVDMILPEGCILVDSGPGVVYRLYQALPQTGYWGLYWVLNCYTVFINRHRAVARGAIMSFVCLYLGVLYRQYSIFRTKWRDMLQVSRSHDITVHDTSPLDTNSQSVQVASGHGTLLPPSMSCTVDGFPEAVSGSGTLNSRHSQSLSAYENILVYRSGHCTPTPSSTSEDVVSVSSPRHSQSLLGAHEDLELHTSGTLPSLSSSSTADVFFDAPSYYGHPRISLGAHKDEDLEVHSSGHGMLPSLSSSSTADVFFEALSDSGRSQISLGDHEDLEIHSSGHGMLPSSSTSSTADVFFDAPSVSSSCDPECSLDALNMETLDWLIAVTNDIGTECRRSDLEWNSRFISLLPSASRNSQFLLDAHEDLELHASGRLPSLSSSSSTADVFFDAPSDFGHSQISLGAHGDEDPEVHTSGALPLLNSSSTADVFFDASSNSGRSQISLGAHEDLESHSSGHGMLPFSSTSSTMDVFFDAPSVLISCDPECSLDALNMETLDWLIAVTDDIGTEYRRSDLEWDSRFISLLPSARCGS